jgi:hypothetical protein
VVVPVRHERRHFVGALAQAAVIFFGELPCGIGGSGDHRCDRTLDAIPLPALGIAQVTANL